MPLIVGCSVVHSFLNQMIYYLPLNSLLRIKASLLKELRKLYGVASPGKAHESWPYSHGKPWPRGASFGGNLPIFILLCYIFGW